jgi:archaellum component FlaG (FlaF/FlaG flagellin family)
MLEEIPTRYITIDDGTIWYDGEEIVLSPIDTSATNYHLYYHSAPNVWTAEHRSQYPNTEYDDNTGGLKTLDNNKWGVIWVYRGITGSDVYVVLGGASYNHLLDVQSTQPPASLPSVIAKQAVLVGRIIIKKSDTTATQIDSSFSVIFTPSGVISHNDLSDIQGGTTNQYYHLTNRQATGLITKTVTFVIDGGSSVPLIGAYASIVIPFAGTITGWKIVLDVSGSCVLDLWKLNAAKPTIANTITAAAKPTLVTSAYVASSTLTGWTTAVVVNDIMTINLDSVTTCKRITLQLEIAI